MPTFRATIVLRIALAAVSISTMTPAGLVLFADSSVPSWLAPMQLMLAADLPQHGVERGSFEGQNPVVSTDRATTAADMLIEAGAPREQITTDGVGSEFPGYNPAEIQPTGTSTQ
ncbi:hypothetical protein [Rhodococcus sp. (in: high G+C Gram-positive bacteria)]|uniref:hypothetical protein n=1 Tax=Rhodococcus sp. TaxID=1831 RepID=UPI003B8A73FA